MNESHDTTRAGVRHVPVMADRVVELLAPALRQLLLTGERPVFVDATLGMGGHSAAILAACPDAQLIGIDRDPAAIERASLRLAAYRDRVHLVHAVYDEIDEVLSDLNVAAADAILFDLGVSSPQIDEPERGFAYSQDAPLDMRMDPTNGVTAAELLATADQNELTRILSEYGEERFARRIASAIVARREDEPLTSSVQLTELVHAAIPAAARFAGGNPAKRTFQALRIAVNDELNTLTRAIQKAIEALRVNGRIVTLAYHSLEDRIVKQALVAASRSDTPPDLPMELPGHEPELQLLVRGSEGPSDIEVADNSRASSVRLRAAMRVRTRSNDRGSERKVAS